MKKCLYLITILIIQTQIAFSNGYLQGIFATYENDSIYKSNSDRYYTDGVQLLFLTNNYNTNKREGFYNYIFGIKQKMFTPYDINEKKFLQYDRPYAGYLSAFLNKNLYHNNGLDSFEISLGCTGKCSLAGETQKKVHKIIKSNPPQGWKYQLKNEFLIMLSYLKMINLNVTKLNDFDWQITPKLQVNLGSPYTEISTKLEFKYGWNIERYDLELNRIYSNQVVSIKPKNLSIYLFAEAGGTYNVYDIFLDGSSFSNYNNSIKKYDLNYEFNGGINVKYKSFYLKYSTIYIPDQFKEQKETECIFMISLGYYL